MWFYALHNQQQGPVNPDVLKTLLQDRTIDGSTLVWKEGMSQWTPLAQTELVKFLLAPASMLAAAPIVPAVPTYPQQPVTPAAYQPYTTQLWYYTYRDERQGPVDEKGLNALILDGTINSHTYVWKQGMPKWIRLSQSELANLLLPAAPTYPQQPAAPGAYQPYNTQRVKPGAVRIKEFQSTFTAYWILLVVYHSLNLITILLSYSLISGSVDYTFWSILSVLKWLPMLAGSILGLILLYRYWAVIQDGYARTTPGKAIGYMFIPFFDFYWIFQVYFGLCQDTNRYILRHQVQSETLSPGVALAYPILFLVAYILSFIPGIGSTLGLICTLVGVVILLIMMSRWKNSACAIIAQQQ